MSLTKFEKDMDVVQKLDDEPNDVGGLTSAALKAKFDEGGEAVKEYLNDVLLPALDAYIARTDNPHAVTKAQVDLGDVDNTADADKPVSTAQQAAIDLKADIAAVLTKTNTSVFTPSASYHPATKKYVDDTTAGVVLGQIPDGTVTEAKMTDDVKEKLNGPRTPTAHAATHHTGGSDPLAPGDIGAADEPLKGSIAPTNSTVGVVGQFYVDTSNKEVYVCTEINEGVYTWSSAKPKELTLIASYTTAGSYTFTVPSGITKLRAFVVGGGGSGASFSASGGVSAAGGGSGHTALVFLDDVTPGTEYPLVVGTGGAAVYSTNSSENNGNSGNSSSIHGIVANGGDGGLFFDSGTNTKHGANGGQGSSGTSLYASQGLKTPAFGEIRLYRDNDGTHFQGNTISSECVNPFDGKKLLIAGGFSESDSGLEIREAAATDDYGNSGSAGAASKNAPATAIKGTSWGCGGGAATSYGHGAVSAAGADGAVLIYGM